MDRHRRLELTFDSDGDACAAWLYLPADPLAPDARGRPPVVVLGHGVAGTRRMRLDAFAERFAAAGLACLVFTYRCFGDSEGQPRQLMSFRRQLADWQAALRFVTMREDVDGERVAVWGSSMGGGHAIAVGHRNPWLRAVVSQCPYTDGIASARALGAPTTLRLLPAVARDLVAMARRSPEAVTVPAAAAPGRVALMNAPDAVPGYAQIAADTGFVNEVAARVVPTMPFYRPGRRAARLRVPALFCVSVDDSVAPTATTLRHVRRCPVGTVRTYDVGHFDFYVGEAFERVVVDQTEFLVDHLR